jgi:hypothetical protein
MKCINKVSFALAVGIAVVRVLPAAAAPNLVADSGFESPAGTLSGLHAPSTFGSWTVNSGSIDIRGTATGYQTIEGSQFLFLNGLARGDIFQDLSTDAGQSYLISFQMAGDVFGNDLSNVKPMQVGFGSSSQTFSFDVTGNTELSLGWTGMSFVATAQSTVTRLEFTSLIDGTGGPAIDAVSVTAIPEPASLGLVTAATFALMRRRAGTKKVQSNVTF